MNPSYDSDKFGWKMIEIEYGKPDYSFNTLMFWKTKTGEIYMAHDSGCSCPTPFEKYEGETEDEIKQKLERVVSLCQAKTNYESHSSICENPNLPWSDVRSKLIEWGLKSCQ